jgi:hypothetical protein
MPAYTFDLKLDAAFTIEASSEDEARRILIETLDCANINCGELPNGDPLLGEASVNDHRVWLATIDGEEVPLPTYPSPLHCFAAARDDGWLPSDEDTPEEYCSGVIEEDVQNADITQYVTEYRDYIENQGKK